MTSPVGIDTFDQARVRVWEKLTPKERDKLAETDTIDDVWRVTQEVQEKQGKRGMLGNMSKIQSYLDGLQRYEKVIEVFVSSNPAILALIWVFCATLLTPIAYTDLVTFQGPIKLLLQVRHLTQMMFRLMLRFAYAEKAIE